MLYTVPIAFSTRGVSLHFQDAIMWLLSTSQLFLQALQCVGTESTGGRP